MCRRQIDKKNPRCFLLIESLDIRLIFRVKTQPALKRAVNLQLIRRGVDKPFKDFVGDTEQKYRSITFWVPYWLRRRPRLKSIPFRSDTSRTGAKGLSFYYPRLLCCVNQMLAVVLLSQHRVSLSKTVRPRAPCGARCIGHAVSTWSAVCSEARHWQFGEGMIPHLCMDEWNRPTPVRRRLSLTQATRGVTSTNFSFLNFGKFLKFL